MKARSPALSKVNWSFAAALLVLTGMCWNATADDGVSVPPPLPGSASQGVFLAQLLALMFVGRLLGEALHRIGQPTVMGQLAGGILLGPSVLGWIAPDLQRSLFPTIGEQHAMIDAVSHFGILLLLLLTGMETDLRLVRRFGRAALSVSSMGVAVPFVCGLALGAVLPDMLLPASDKRLVTSLFLGTAFAISSIKIVAAIVHEMNFTRRDLGQIIVSSAIMEDTIGWVIIAITSSLAAANTIQVFGLIKALIGTAAFLVASFTVGRWFVIHAIRWANDHFESEFPVITTILLVMGGMALTTEAIGVNTVLGAFIAGVLIGESPILTRHIEEQLRGLIVAFFMPVFFGLAGLGTDLTILKDPHLLLLTLAIVAVASVGKFGGAFAGGAIGGLISTGGVGARLRDERPRLDRGDCRHHRPFDGRADAKSIHDDRRDGGRNNARDATDAAPWPCQCADQRR